MIPERVIVLVCDGMSDRPVRERGNKTPLEVALTPNMDSLAFEGACGIMDPIAPGIRPGSDTSHLALLGYDPYKVYTGRGPFEAAGVGLKLEPGDIAFRCNYATADESGKITDRRAGRIKHGTLELAKELDGLEIDGARTIFADATEHRAVLILRGEGLSCNITDPDPHKDGRVPESKPLDDTPEAKRTADIMNRFTEMSTKLLKDHPVNKKRIENGELPANVVLARGGGVTPELPSLKECYGWRALGIVGVSLIRGICLLAGMDVPVVEGATGGLDTNMLMKAKEALKGLYEHNYVFINIKAPDICGHDGDFDGKVETIERVDETVGYLKTNLPDDTGLVLTVDHSTPVTVKGHSADPVPLCIYGPGVRCDGTKAFTEREVALGCLGRMTGKDLMPVIVDWLDKAEKFGA
jgi:2,3-bisphosphoglycerate-independent phosphoglycerate mutase